MPSETPSALDTQVNIEETEDFKYFKEFVQNNQVDRLLPLEEQLQLKKQKQDELLALAAFEDSEAKAKVTFRVLGEEAATIEEIVPKKNKKPQKTVQVAPLVAQINEQYVAPKKKFDKKKKKNIDEPFELERNYDYGATKDLNKKQYYKQKDYH